MRYRPIPCRTRSLGPVLVVAAALSAGVAGPVTAQELGASLGRGTSAFIEFGSPTHRSVHGRLPLPMWSLHLTGSYRAHRDAGQLAGTTCDVYWPQYQGCVDEPIAYDTRLTQWGVGLGAGMEVAERLELRGDVLRVWNTLQASSAGAETNRSTGSVYPGETVTSTAYVVGATWSPWVGWPLAVAGEFRAESLDFRGCVTDTRVPFCRPENLTSLELGLVLTARGLRR